MTGAQMIARERTRQREKEGWTAEHDNGHRNDELAMAAAVYALPARVRTETIFGRQLRHILWPWDARYWKPSPDRIHELVKAGALIAAEIDRLQRAISTTEERPGLMGPKYRE